MARHLEDVMSMATTTQFHAAVSSRPYYSLAPMELPTTEPLLIKKGLCEGMKLCGTRV
ncbi:unnamed protein product [Brassica rapa]|uniref:Uncharacterized protein n=2 Tax=Brassica TaxID=3705 RepID=A0A8D9GZY9_BRACM|nr:unnamed protein product [Brassica napus]CAG7889892.1 unnamed protein product [Brassica rapa]